MADKAPTEAQQLLDELVNGLGLTVSGVAKELGVPAMQMHNIARRHSSGNTIVHRLSILRDQMQAAKRGPARPASDVSSTVLRDALPDVASLFAPVQDAAEPATLALNGEEPTPAPKKPLTERASDFLRAAMLGQPTVEAPKASKKASDGKVSPRDIAEQVTPIVSGFIVLGVDWLLRDPYKPCAPTDQEAYAMLYPIVKRLARKLEAQREITEDDMELLGMALAITAYGRRARGVYKQIHAMEVERVRSNDSTGATSAATYVAASGPTSSPASNPTTAPGHASTSQRGPDASAPVAGPAGARGAASRGAGRGASGERPGAPERQANALLDQLLEQDAAGRRRLGIG